MKKLLFFVLAICLGSFLYAQQLHLTQFATLNHNDSITAYYGPSAFISAHDAAVHGDIVTLSPGTFTATNITKAITIRGAGMMKDTIANTLPTIIQGDFFSISVNNVPENHLFIEGIYFTGRLLYQTGFSPHFKKCRFNTISRHAWGEGFALPLFTNCLISNWDGSSLANNAMFVNCIILNVMTGSEWTYYWSDGWGGFWNNNEQYQCGQSSDVFYNCIINIPPNFIGYKRDIVNCITYTTSTTQSIGTNVYNTIGITDSTNYYSVSNDHNNSNVYGFENIFKTFRGTYTDGENFELTEAAATTYLGTDGTQVGIYGGSAVYNPKSTDMRIRKYSVGFYSDENGQLKITTELEDE